jgi:hypothetical protein
MPSLVRTRSSIGRICWRGIPASTVVNDVDVLHTVVEWGSYDAEQAPAPAGRCAVWLLPTPGGRCAALAGDTAAARQEIALSIWPLAGTRTRGAPSTTR